VNAQGPDLLGALGSTVRRAGDAAANAPASVRGSIDSAGFGALLERARGGGLSSGKPVAIDPALGVELSRAQLDRLAAAADRAQASGAERAAVVIDGSVYELDVRGRKITGEIRPGPGEVMTGIDALVRIGGEDEPERPSPERLLSALGRG